jgi:sporulation protein YlmC with PRC-barrel domain
VKRPGGGAAGDAAAVRTEKGDPRMGQTTEKRLEAFMPMADLEGKRSFSFTDIRGFEILNTTGHKVGKVQEVFVDPNTLEPGFALLDYQKFMNFNVKHLLVPWHELILGEGYVQTRWTEDQLLPHTLAEQQANLAEMEEEEQEAAAFVSG